MAAYAIAGEHRVAAEQGIAGTFEVQIVRHVFNFETGGTQPRFIVRHFALPLRIAEVRHHGHFPINKRRVRREHQVGQPRLRGQQIDGRSCIF